MTTTAKVKKTYFDGGEELMIYRNGSLTELISIDRTFYGPEWNEKHGMVITETVDADNGEKFDVWRRKDELVGATPHKEG